MDGAVILCGRANFCTKCFGQAGREENNGFDFRSYRREWVREKLVLP